MYLNNINKNSRFNDLKKEYLNGQDIMIICDKLPYHHVKFNPDITYYNSGYCLGLALYNLNK